MSVKVEDVAKLQIQTCERHGSCRECVAEYQSVIRQQWQLREIALWNDQRQHKQMRKLFESDLFPVIGRLARFVPKEYPHPILRSR